VKEANVPSQSSMNLIFISYASTVNLTFHHFVFTFQPKMESPGVPCGRGTWEQVGSDITGPEPLPGLSLTSFGRAVSLSHDGAIVAVGGPLAGAQVYGYDWDDDKWTQMGSDIKPGQGTFAVSLNKWGDRVAAAASRISTNGLTFNGAVKIYEYAGSDWTQLGNSIVGEADAEQIGEWEEALSLSEDGDTVAIGSFWKQIVRIYHFSNDTWSKIGDFVVRCYLETKISTSLELQSRCLRRETFLPLGPIVLRTLWGK
jgi:hypothetical protein